MKGQSASHATPAQIWRALRQARPDDRPPGVTRRRYRFPLSWFLSMAPDLLLGRPRDFRGDCELAVRLLPVAPVIEGLEHIPRDGSLVVVANHYQRRDLWVGWPGALICHAMWRVRPDTRCTFMTEDRAVVDGASVRWSRPLFARVACVWGLVLVTPPEARDGGTENSRRRALLRCVRLVSSPERPVALCIMPEGITGTTGALREPVPGSGRALLALAAAGAKLLSAAVWEEPSGALHLRLGPPWAPDTSDLPRDQVDAAVAREAMRRIAALMPPAYRGPFSAPEPCEP